MFTRRSITGRIAIGVCVGVAYGAIVLAALPLFGASLSPAFALGTALHFVMLGFVIGLVGVFDTHPLFGFTMRWWIRGLVAGTIFGTMYVLIGYDTIATLMQAPVVQRFGFSSPWWALCDFWFAGLIMAYLETRFAGEGSSLPLR